MYVCIGFVRWFFQQPVLLSICCWGGARTACGEGRGGRHASWQGNQHDMTVMYSKPLCWFHGVLCVSCKETSACCGHVVLRVPVFCCARLQVVSLQSRCGRQAHHTRSCSLPHSYGTKAQHTGVCGRHVVQHGSQQ